MIKQAYIKGFLRKCTEYRIDPTALLKLALDPAVAGSTEPVAPPQQPPDMATAPGTNQKLKYPNPLKSGILSRQPLSQTDMQNFGLISATPSQLSAAMEKVLAQKRKKEQPRTQPVFITR